MPHFLQKNAGFSHKHYLGKIRLNKNNTNTVIIVTITIEPTLYLGALKNFSSVYVKKRIRAVIIRIPQNNE